MKKQTQLVICAIIFVVAAGIRAQHLFQPWVGAHNAWGGAMYGNIARNYLKYGYWETKLGPVANSGQTTPDKFEFYYHYPPLLVWLVSLSYRVFGIHEWSARLPALIFSLLSMWLLYIFARRFFSTEIALMSLFFSAVMPIENYYAAHVDVYGSLAVFFTLLAVYGYARWLLSYRNSDLALCNLGVILGCLTSWYTYFLVPLLLAHYYFLYLRPGKSRYYRLLTLVGSAVAVFVLFLLHRHILLGAGQEEILGTLFEKLITRMSYGAGDGASGVIYIYRQHAKDLIRMYSLPLLLLTGIWVILFINKALNKRLSHADWLVMLLLGYGFLHNLIFPSLLPGHDYLSVCYTPGIALAAAAVVCEGRRYVENAWRARMRRAAAAALLALVGVTGLYMSQRLYLREDLDYPRRLKKWGEVIRNSSRAGDVVLAPLREDRIFQYYVEREMAFEIDTLEEIDRLSGGKKADYLFVCPAAHATELKDLLQSLGAKYPGRNEHGLIIYTIRQTEQP